MKHGDVDPRRFVMSDGGNTTGRTRCSCSFAHPPHDWCDGNPDAVPFDDSPTPDQIAYGTAAGGGGSLWLMAEVKKMMHDAGLPDMDEPDTLPADPNR